MRNQFSIESNEKERRMIKKGTGGGTYLATFNNQLEEGKVYFENERKIW